MGHFDRYFLHLFGADYIIFLNMCYCREEDVNVQYEYSRRDFGF